jgi:hypothetical protein
MDFGTASAAWVILGDANVSGFQVGAYSCDDPKQDFYSPNAVLSSKSGRQIEVGANITATFSLRFGEGWHASGTVDAGR